MRKKKFKVFFASGDVLVGAFTENEAKILAQAQAIKNGWDYTVFKITEIQKCSAQSADDTGHGARGL